MHTFIRLVSFSFVLLLCACAKGPDDTAQLATQGLLSGEISPGGDMAVVGSIHHGGSLWNLTNKERLFDWNHKSGGFSSLRAAAISGNGKVAVTSEEDAFVVWDTVTGESKNFWQASDRVLSVKLNWKGDKALIGTSKGEASYFDLVTGAALQTFNHSAEIRDVDMDKEGTIGLTASDDKTASIWDLKSGENIRTITLTNHIKTAALSPSGKLAFITSQREDAVILDVDTGEKVFSLTNRYTNYTTATFSENEEYLSAGTFQGEVKRWSIKGGAEVAKWQAKPRQAYGGANSKSIISIVDAGNSLLVLTSDGQYQSFAL